MSKMYSVMSRFHSVIDISLQCSPKSHSSTSAKCNARVTEHGPIKHALFLLRNIAVFHGKGYGQHQSLCVATIHHQSRAEPQRHDGHQVTRGEQH